MLGPLAQGGCVRALPLLLISLLLAATPAAASVHSSPERTLNPADARLTTLPAGAREVALIDTGVKDWRSLARGVSDEVAIVRVRPEEDGLTRLAQVLKGHSGIRALHVISHGEPGRIRLGNVEIDTATLGERVGESRTIRAALAPGADILIAGCRVARSRVGAEFVGKLAAWSGADVAASTDVIGRTEAGPSWSLETRIGNVETTLAIDAEARSTFRGRLPISSEVTFGFSKYDGSLANGGAYNDTIEADGTTDQMTFSDWRIDEFDAPDYGVNMNNGGPNSTFSDPAGDNFQFVSFTTEVFCGTNWSFDVVGYKNGTPVAGATQTYILGGVGGPTTRSVGFASVDEVRFENYSTDNGNQCMVIDDIIVDQEVVSNTAPGFSNLDATVAFDEVAGTPVVIDADATVEDTELDSAGDYAGSTLTVEREGGANGDDDFGFDTGAGTFTVSGGDLLSGGSVFASFTDTGGTLTVSFNSSGTTATPALVDDVLQGVTYENTGNPIVVDYGLAFGFDDGGLQASKSLPVEYDPALTAIAASATWDLTELEPVLGNLDPIDGRIIAESTYELLFRGFQFGDASESGSISSSELQLDQVTSDVGTTGAIFESDEPFSLESIDIDNFSTFAQDVTVHAYLDGSLLDSRSFSYGASSGYQTRQFASANASFANVDEIRVTTSVNDSVAFDNIVADVGNTAPELGGTPADATVSEDVATAIDLSAYNVSDADGDNVTLTLAVDRGTVASIDGDGTTAGVTVAGSSSASMTLAGSAADLNAYLNDTSKIEYTTDSNDTTAATLTVTPNDGTTDGTADTVTINVSPVNDAPTVSGAPSDVTVTEDTQSNVDLSAMSFADVDGDDLTVTLAASGGTFATPANGAGVGAGVTETRVNATTITLAGAAGDISSYLDTASNIQYTAAANVSGQDQATITVSASDGNGGSLAADPNINIDVTAVNDVPVFSGLDGTPSFTEGGSAVLLDSNVTVTDQELASLNGGNGNFAGASLVIARNGGANTVDDFSIASSGNLTVSGGNISAGGNVIASFDTGSVAGQVTVGFQNNGTTPTTALVNEVLQAIRYANSSDDPASSVQLDWTFSDGNSGDAQGTGDNPGTVTGSTTVTLTNVNDPPTLTATGGNPTYQEGNAASDLYNTVTADTVEDTGTTDRFTSLSLTVTNVSDGASEILTFDGSDVALTDGNSVTTATNTLGVSVSVTGSTATVSFSGASLTEARMGTLVDGLAYRNTSDNPATGSDRVVTITGITDDGGTANGGNDSAAPNIASTVSLIAVNDPPAIGNLSGDTSALEAGGPGTNIDDGGDATVSNVDSADYNGGSLTITDNGANNTANGDFAVDGTSVTANGDGTIAAGETIAVGGVPIGTVAATNDGQGGNPLRIDFNADADNARVQTLLRNVGWRAAAGSGSQTFTATVNDGDGTANGGDPDASADFTLVLGNPPTLGGAAGDVTITEDTTTAIDLSAYSVADADGDVVTLTLAVDAGTIATTDGNGTTGGVTIAGSGAATMALEGTVADLNTYLDDASKVEYTPVENSNTTATLTVTPSDGFLTGSADTVAIGITAVNDAPTFSSAPSDVTVNEDDPVPSISFTVDDVESGGAGVSVSASSDNQMLVPDANLSVSDNGGGDRTLDVTLVPDVNGTATITVTLDDGTDSAADSFTLTVNPQNDAPAVSLDRNANTIAENNGGAVTVAQITILDDNEAGSTNNLSLSGADAADFMINGGNLDFTASADFESKSTYTVGVEVDDPAVGVSPDDTAGFTLNISDVPDNPTVTAPPDLTGANAVDASGLYTQVDLERDGDATANDDEDGTLTPEPESVDNPVWLRPGTNTITWTVTDSSGASATEDQIVEVRPRAALGVDRTVQEGTRVELPVELNGQVIDGTTPMIGFDVAGSSTATGTDYAGFVAPGSITLTSRTATLDFDVLADGAPESPETLVIETTGASEAALAQRTQATVTLTEENQPPLVTLSAAQSGGADPAVVIDKSAGNVTVSADTSDATATGSMTFDWSASGLTDTDGAANDETFVFDPSALSAGVYTLSVEAEDNGSSAETGQARIALRVLDSLPALAGTDTDNDGLADNDPDEGRADRDGDLIPDYRDPYRDANTLHQVLSDNAGYRLETEPGLNLALGAVAFAVDADGARVSADEIATVSGWRDDRANVGGRFDFTLYGLPHPGASAHVVIPQRAPIPEQAVYRLTGVMGNWQTFASNPDNALASAPGAPGYCPPPDDPAFTTGLTPGDHCVRLTLKDGGMNDADGEANGRIRTTGGVARQRQTPDRVEVESSGGVWSPVWFWILAVFGTLRVVRSRGLY